MGGQALSLLLVHVAPTFRVPLTVYHEAISDDPVARDPSLISAPVNIGLQRPFGAHYYLLEKKKIKDEL